MLQGTPQPRYIQERLKLFTRLQEDTLGQQEEGRGITVRVAGGSTVPGHAGQTTPYEVAAGMR